MSDEINVSIDGEKAVFEDKNTVIAKDIVAGEELPLRVESTNPEVFEDEINPEDLSEEELEELRQQWSNEFYPLPDEFPTEEVLAQWSEKFGRIRVRRMAPKEAYVLRRMTRSEFRQFLKAVEAHGGEPIENKMYQEELMVEMCTVWPQVTMRDIRGETNAFAPIASAGTASILSADIQEISNMLAEAIGPIEEL
jgi:hypothetical protein